MCVDDTTAEQPTEDNQILVKTQIFDVSTSLHVTINPLDDACDTARPVSTQHSRY